MRAAIFVSVLFAIGCASARPLAQVYRKEQVTLPGCERQALRSGAIEWQCTDGAVVSVWRRRARDLPRAMDEYVRGTRATFAGCPEGAFRGCGADLEEFAFGSFDVAGSDEARSYLYMDMTGMVAAKREGATYVAASCGGDLDVRAACKARIEALLAEL